MSILVLAPHYRGRLSATLPRAITALAQVGGEIIVLVAGETVGDAATEAAGIAGVSRVIAVDGAALGHQPADLLATLLQTHGTGMSHIATLADVVGRDALGRTAAKFGTMPVTEVIAVHGPDRFDRPTYAGNAIDTVTVTGEPILLSIRAAAFDPAGAQDAAPVETVAYDGPESAIAFVSEESADSDRPDLATARIVVSGGVSLGSKEKFALIEELAAKLGAAVGATRAAVDLGYAPNDWQVGQTGKSVAPDLYIAVGISGAQQHLAGIKNAKKIIAINSDPEAPIVKIADAALIGDLFEIVPALIADLEKS